MQKDKAEYFAKQISFEIEKSLRNFLELSFREQIEKTKLDISENINHHSDIKSRKKKAVPLITKVLEKVIEDLQESTNEVKEENVFWERFEGITWTFINAQIAGGVFNHFLRYLFTQALIGNRTDTLLIPYRQKLKAEFQLIQPSNFKDALFEILDPLFIPPMEYEDLTYFWTKNKGLELLSNYNRLSFVIKNARSELKEMKRNSREQISKIRNKYGIPDDLMDLVNSPKRISELALDWSLKILEIERRMEEFFNNRKSPKLKKEVIDLSYEHINNRILKKARNECPSKRTLVYCTFYGGGRQLGSVNPKSENVKLLRVDVWSSEEAFGDSIFFEGCSF